MSARGAAEASVIVLTWNGLEVTRRCVESILGMTAHPDFEVMVVDNGSTDGTVEYLRGVAGIGLIENGQNLGFVGGNNAGIRASTRDVVLLNNDTEIIQADWLARMQELACSSADIGIVGCRLVNAEGDLVHAGTYMPVPSFWGQEYPGDEKDIGQYVRDREVDGVIAACVYIKRELIEKIGLLDEDYFSYFEDTDYCLKARESGYRVFCCGGVTVKHLENASTDLNRMDFSGTFKQSRETFLKKWNGYYDSRYTHRLTWRSYISGGGAYPRLSSKILTALDVAGVDVNLAFLEGADRAELDDFRINDMKNRGADRDRPQVVFAPPTELSSADGAYNIGYVSTPYDRFPDEWVGGINRMDEVWVPSEFQREAALASGVKREVAVVPFGVDPDYLHPAIKAYPLGDRFTFLAPIDWGPGFASETLLRAFTDEFGEDENAVLVVKVTSPSPGAEVEQAVEALNLPLDRAPVVFVVDHDVPGYQAGCLYRSADCLVLVQTASDAGLAAAEALSCGVPVIATGWGSVEALLDAEGAFAIDCELVPATAVGLKTARPDYEHLRRLLRRLYTDIDAAKKGALSASRTITEGLGWDAVARKIIERLDGIR